eukprot:scaffold36979_cov18-Prasinocladus_malaysianus.AAC.1
MDWNALWLNGMERNAMEWNSIICDANSRHGRGSSIRSEGRRAAPTPRPPASNCHADPPARPLANISGHSKYGR